MGTKLASLPALPFKMKIKCTTSIDGGTMAGKAKASMMSVAFAGTRKAA